MARYALSLAAALALATTGIAPIAPPGLGGMLGGGMGMLGGAATCTSGDMETFMKISSWCVPRGGGQSKEGNDVEGGKEGGGGGRGKGSGEGWAGGMGRGAHRESGVHHSGGPALLLRPD
jgi:hypothetical protein